MTATQDVDGAGSSVPQLLTDEAVNALLEDYNSNAEYPISAENINQGNMKSKAIVSLEDLYIEAVDSPRSGFITVEISGSGDQKDLIYCVFRDFLLSNGADSSGTETA